MDTWAGETNSVQSLFTAEGTVTSNTKSIAIQDPLQYAVAQLALKVKAEGNSFTDQEGTVVDINNGVKDLFRLTGVIVGGQRRVGYDFAPLNNSDVDVKFVYDSQVQNDFTLTTTGFDDQNVKEFNTLVLQSYDGENVNVILECIQVSHWLCLS